MIRHPLKTAATLTVLAILPICGTTAASAATDGVGIAKELAAEALQVSTTQPDGTFEVSVGAGEYVDASGARRSFAARTVWTCALKTHNPHYSSGAKGVIAKATVSCTGDFAVLPIRVYMMLGRTTTNSISSLKVVKESNYTQNVTVNGSGRTWYVPQTGNGATRGAYFRASSSAQPAPPLIPFNIPAHASAFLWVN